MRVSLRCSWKLLHVLVALAPPTSARADAPVAGPVARTDAASAAEEEARAARDLRTALKVQRDPAKLNQEIAQMFGSLKVQRRWRRLAAESRAILSVDLPPSPPGYPSLKEQAQHNLVLAAEVYRDWDGVLREGGTFLQQYPHSVYFLGVRGKVDTARNEKRLVEQGPKNAAAEIAKLIPADRQNACRLVAIYARNRQWREARRRLESATPGQCAPGQIELLWYQLGIQTGDFRLATEMLERLKNTDPELYNAQRFFATMFPVD